MLNRIDSHHSITNLSYDLLLFHQELCDSIVMPKSKKIKILINFTNCFYIPNYFIFVIYSHWFYRNPNISILYLPVFYILNRNI